MAELLVRLVVLFAVVFGIAYGLTRAARSAKQKKILAELATAREQLAGLRQALAAGELSQREHDDLSVRIYEKCKDRGVPLDEEVVVEASDPEDQRGRRA